MKLTQTRNRKSTATVSKYIPLLRNLYGLSSSQIARRLGVSDQLVWSALSGQPVGKVNDKCAAFYAKTLDLDLELAQAKSATTNEALERENKLQAAKIADQLATLANLRSELNGQREASREQATVITALTKYIARGDK